MPQISPTHRTKFVQIIKQSLLSSAVIGSFAAYALYERLHTGLEAAPTPKVTALVVTPTLSPAPPVNGRGARPDTPGNSTQPFPRRDDDVARPNGPGNNAQPFPRREDDANRQNRRNENPPPGAPRNAPPPLVTNTPVPATRTPLPSPTPRSSPVDSAQGQYKNGEFVGSIADAHFGPLQVKAIIESGRLVDVQFLDYPKSRRASVRINDAAMPRLKTEAVQAQSAQVDVISGATLTSKAFTQSLQAALDKANSRP